MAKFEIKWEAPEFEYREREASWYWISIIIAAAIIALSVWQKNFLFGLFIVIAEILVIVWGNKTPRTVAFALTEQGIEIEGGKNYPFGEMDAFSVDVAHKDEPWDTVIFHFRGKFKLPLMVKLPKEKLEKTKESVKQVLKETVYEPSLIDSLEKLIGF